MPFFSRASNFLKNLNFSFNSSSRDILGVAGISGLGILLKLLNPSHVLSFFSLLILSTFSKLTFNFSSLLVKGIVLLVFSSLYGLLTLNSGLKISERLTSFVIIGLISSLKSFNSLSSLDISSISISDVGVLLEVLFSFINNSIPPPKLILGFVDLVEIFKTSLDILLISITSGINSVIMII